MKHNWSHLAPAGANREAEIKFFFLALGAVTLISSLWFTGSYLNERANLYLLIAGKNVLIHMAMIKDFSEILGRSLYGFFSLAISMVGVIFFHYLSHYIGSKSIYLMKRLPNPRELHKRCLTLPILGILLCLFTAFLLMLLFYGIYHVFTPEQCIPPHQWQKIWRL